MYQCGDKVLYGIHGVCEILNLEVQKIGGKKIEYYVLEPIEQSGARFYVPTQNETAVSKLRPMLTKEQLASLLNKDDAVADVWVDDENQRKQRYRELITSGDRIALVQMVHTLHRHRLMQLDAGKKVHLCDENFLRDAQKILSSEFSLVLDIPQDEVSDYVQNALNINK